MCGHWEEDCFVDELMTGFNTGELKISSVTVATLQDIGYEVDFRAGDSFTREDFGPSCQCNSIEAAPSNNKLGGNFVTTTVQGGTGKKGDQTPAIPTKKLGKFDLGSYGPRGGKISVKSLGKIGGGRSRRKLSGDGLKIASDFGRAQLRVNAEKKKKMSFFNTHKYVGDTVISILYEEDGMVFAVEVHNTDP
jgi:hypothetical protein